MPDGNPFEAAWDGIQAMRHEVRMDVHVRVERPGAYIRFEEPVVQEVRTPQQVAREQMIFQNRSRARLLRGNIAWRRARELLLSHLDEQQRADFLANGWFKVRSQSGREYTITGRGYSHNVLGEGQSWCIHAWDSSLPMPDHMLAQMLMLRASEDLFRQIAYRSPQHLVFRDTPQHAVFPHR